MFQIFLNKKLMFTQYDDEGNLQMVEEPSADYIYTYADYLKFKFEERLELLRGRLMKMAAPNTKHQVVAGNLYYYLRSRLNKQSCNVFIAPFDVRLPVQNRKKDNEITTVVQPDISVVCAPDKIDEKGCCGAPDIIIEILSPGNSRRELQNKFELYQEAGVLEYWIVAPTEEFLIIWYLENGKYIQSKPFSAGQTITSSVLPGFQLDTTDIFK
jgi:Uma2 family endonuclease